MTISTLPSIVTQPLNSSREQRATNTIEKFEYLLFKGVMPAQHLV